VQRKNLFCKCFDILLLKSHGEISFLNQASCNRTMSKEVNKLLISYSINYITEVYSGINGYLRICQLRTIQVNTRVIKFTIKLQLQPNMIESNVF